VDRGVLRLGRALGFDAVKLGHRGGDSAGQLDAALGELR
jgi:hypothetical protein